MGQYAQSIQFLLSQVRRAAGSLEDGLVYAYAAGNTTTPKTIWLDRGKTTEAANPYTLDANGTAEIFGDGVYRFVIKSSAGITVYDRDYISIKDASNLAYDVADYASLAAAVAAIGSTPATLQYSTDQTLAANLTIPATLKLMPLNGSVINHSAYTIGGVIDSSYFPLAQVFNGSGAIYGLIQSRPEWFSGGLSSAIAAVASGGELRLHGGTYEFATAISASLSGAQTWIAEGPTTIKYTGTETSYMLLLTLNSNDITIKGPLVIDANQKGRFALRINNSVANMGLAANVTMEGVTAKNAYSTDVATHTGSAGITIYGGYNKVHLTRCGASNISRAAGVGTPGVTSSNGLMIIGNSITSYVREAVVIDPYIDTVISEEPDGGANNLDCDGLAVFGPSAADNGGKRLDTSFTLRGGRFRNCRGRSIKTQMEQNLLDGPTFVRDSTSARSIAVGMEVDFQYGSGVLKNWRCNYSALGDGSTPLGDSFAIVQATVRNYTSVSALGEGAVVIDTGEITNHIPYGTDAIPHVLSLTSTQTGGVNGKFSNVVVRNLTFLGEGGIDSVVYGDITHIKQLDTSNNFFYKIGVALVYATASAESCKWTALNNTVPNSSSATLWKAYEGNPPTLMACGNNPNFNGAATYDMGESVSLIDDASYVFANHGATTVGIYAIKNNFNQLSQALFVLHTTVLDLTNAATTSVAYGNGVNPDIDGKLNVWRDANGRVNIKNRLGSTRIFTLNAL